MPADMSPMADSAPRPAAPLPPGWRLGGWEIQRAIARSESSVVYLATDHALDMAVAIQEYLPARFAQRDAAYHLHGGNPSRDEVIARGLLAFVSEARLLARCDHPSLVRVSGLFEALGTAYRVMPLYDGRRLLDVRRDMRTPPDEASLRSLTHALLGALEAFHRSGQGHGGVTPANILLLADDRPLLLGPGAADREIASDLVESLMAGLEPSFTPPNAGAGAHLQRGSVSADLYALAEVLRFCITAELPAASTAPREREPLAAVIAGAFEPAARPRYSAALLGVIDAACSADALQRPHSAAQFRDWLEKREPPAPRPVPPLLMPMPPVESRPGPVLLEPEFEPEPEPASEPEPAPKAEAQAQGEAEPEPEPVLASEPPLPPPVVPPSPPSPLPPPIGTAADTSTLAPPPTAIAEPVPLAGTVRAAPSQPLRWTPRLVGAGVLLATALVVALALGAWQGVTSMRQDRFNAAAARSVAVAPVTTPTAVPTPVPAPVPTTSAISTLPETPPEAAPATMTRPDVAEAVAANDTAARVEPAATAAAGGADASRMERAEAAAAGPAAKQVPTATRLPPPASKPAARKPPPQAASRSVAKPVAQPARLQSPRAACAAKTEFSLYRCMQAQCQQARWKSHAQCTRLRTQDSVG